MPTTTREQEWETHKVKLWGLWVRDKLPMKALDIRMRSMGFYASTKEYVDRFNYWGFSQNIPSEAWRYVGHHIKAQKRPVDDNLVIVSGVQIPNKRVKKETSRHFYSTSDLIQHPNPQRPNKPLVSVCPVGVFPPETFNFPWAPTMPWINFSQNVSLPNALLGNLSGGEMRQGASNSTDGLVSLTRTTLQVPTSKNSGSCQDIAMTLGALMPEAFPGEHLLHGQLLTEQTHNAALSALGFLAFRVSNGNDLPDTTILALMNELNLMKLLRKGDPTLKMPTTIAILTRILVASIRSLQISTLDWVLSLDVLDPNARHFRGHLLLPVVLDICGIRNCAPGCIHCPRPWCNVRISKDRWETARVLLSYGACPSTFCCSSHGTGLSLSALNYRLHPLITCVGAGFQNNGVETLIMFDWQTMFCKASRNPGHRLKDDAFSYLLGLYDAAYPGTDIVGLFQKPSDLIKAAIEGGSRLLKLLHSRGANFDCCDEYGQFPLGVAIKAKKDQFSRGLAKDNAKVLLDSGASVNLQPVGSEGSCLNALHIAITSGDGTACEYLLQGGANPNSTASYCPSHPIYASLFPQGNPDSKNIVASALEIFILAAVLHRSWAANSLRIVELMLNCGAKPHGDELLYLFSHWERFGGESDGIAQLFILSGVDITRKSPDGRTALSIALERKLIGPTKVLLDFCVPKGFGSWDSILADPCPVSKVILALRGRIKSLDECVAILKDEAPYCNGDLLLREAVLYPESFSIAFGAESHPEVIKYVLHHFPQAYSTPVVDALLDSLHLPEIAQEVIKRRSIGPYEPSTDGPVIISAARKYSQRSKSQNPFRQFLGRLTDIELVPPLKGPLLQIFTLNFGWLHTRPTWIATTEFLAEILAAGFKPTPLVLMLTDRLVVDHAEWLVSRGFDPGRRYCWSNTALQRAVGFGNVGMVEFLLGRGVNVNAAPPWHAAPVIMRSGWILRDSNRPRTAIQMAVSKFDLELISILVNAGADVNAPAARYQGATALQLAAINGHTGLAKWLISLGADVNAAAAEYHGRSALEGASEYGRIDTVQLLVDEGCNLAGEGRRQFVRAVGFSRRGGHLALAAHLQQLGHWNQEDEKALNRESLDCEHCHGKAGADNLCQKDWLSDCEHCEYIDSISDTISEPTCWRESQARRAGGEMTNGSRASTAAGTGQAIDVQSSDAVQCEESATGMDFDWVEDLTKNSNKLECLVKNRAAIESYQARWVEISKPKGPVEDVTDRERLPRLPWFEVYL